MTSIQCSGIPNNVTSKLYKNKHNDPTSPICLMKQRIYHYFDNVLKVPFDKFDDLDPIVDTEKNFDLLLIPKTHPSRSKSDTYYVSDTHVLRTHTSAHQNELLAKGYESFLICGDVYRKDEIDRFHYPVFHQIEGVMLCDDPESKLKEVLIGLVNYLFPEKPYRLNDDYFPFTNPSFEIEVWNGEKWVEILGCGVIQPAILEHNKIEKTGWAFGIGIERLCMILYGIPDIRLFWTTDDKFIDQFKGKTCLDEIKFVPYSNIPPLIKDISFWLNTDDVEKTTDDFTWKLTNDFYDCVRTVCDNNIEKVELLDHFHHPKKDRYSNTWRFTFSCTDPKIKNRDEYNDMCNAQMMHIRDALVASLGLEIR